MAPKLKLNRRLCCDCKHADVEVGTALQRHCTKTNMTCRETRTLDFVDGTPRCTAAGLWWELKR